MQELQKEMLGCRRGLGCSGTALGVHVCARQTATASACVGESCVHTHVQWWALPEWTEGCGHTCV